VRSINWSLSPEWVCGGTKLALALRPLGRGGAALESMHYFTQQVTAQHTGTNANRRRGVSERCVCVDVHTAS